MHAHLGRVHDHGHGDLTRNVGTQADGGQFGQLPQHSLGKADHFNIGASASTLAVEALGHGMHADQWDLDAQLPHDLQHGGHSAA